MGFFDTFKVMKDIVTGGIEAFKAGEKLDELINQAADDYDDVLTAADESLLAEYRKAKTDYDENYEPKNNDELLEALESAQIAFLESLLENSSLPKKFRAEIKTAIQDFKQADNKALDTLSDVLEKNAENDEQRAEIRRAVDEARRK